MPEFYTWVFVFLINQSEEIGKKQLSVFGSRGGQISRLMHVAFESEIEWTQYNLGHERVAIKVPKKMF